MAKKVVRHTRLVALASLAVAFLFSMNALIVPVEARQADMWMSSNSDWSQSLLPFTTLTVTAPTATETIPTNFVVPIVVGDTTGQGITAFQFNILYNPAYIHPLNNGNFGCDTTGTISNTGVAGQANLQPTCNVVPDGTLRVSAAGAKPMTGAGTVVNITFTIDPAAVGGNISPLSFEAGSVFFFGNSGTTLVPNTPVDGQITLHDTSTTTISCAPGTFVYTASPITPCIATVTGSGGLNTTTPVTYTNNTNVGTATANATYGGDAAHDGSSDSKTFAITPAPSTTVVTCPASVVYTGVAQTPCTVLVTGVGGLSLTPPPTYTNNTNVGTANASYTYAGDANHSGSSDSKNFSITLAPSTTVVTCPASVVYTGAAQTPCTVLVTGVGGLSLTPPPTYGNNTNVGTATASYIFTGDANHSSSSDLKTFSITLATSTTVVTCPASVVYTGAAQTPCTVLVTGVGGLSLTPTPTYGNNTNVGTATASYIFTGDANHSSSSDLKTFSITLATSTTVVTCPASVVYTGAAQTPCTVLVTGVGGLSLTPTPTYGNNTNVGTATASYIFTGDANHSGSSDSKNFSITLATSTTVVTCPASVVYTGAAQTPCTVSVTGVGGLSLTPTPTYTNNTNVGTANASYTYAGDANHSGSSDSKTFAITLATSTTVVTCPASVVYTGAAQTPCTVSVTGVGGLSLTPTPTYTNNTNVGTATASYAFAGDANHSGSSDTKNFDIITGTITGNIDYAIVSKPVRNVTLDAPGSPSVSGVDDSSGNYSLTNFGPGAYTVTPSKPAQPCLTSNGVFANDASLVLQHVVHTITLSADQQAAAQVGGFGIVTAGDASLIAQKVVGICNPGNAAGQWRFNPTSVPHASVSGTIVENYKAIMMGDVTGDWNNTLPAAPTTESGIANAVRASVPDVDSHAGSTVVVPFRLENLSGAGVTSYQFDIEYDPAVIEPAHVAADLTGTISNGLSVVWNTPTPGLLKVAVYGALPVTGDGEFVNLRFSTIGAAGAASPLRIRGFQFNDGTTQTVTTDGQVSVTQASGAAIQGRLLAPTGEGLRNAQVMLTNSAGVQVGATSSTFGYFRFEGLTVGETYTITVQSRRYRFASRTLSATDDLTEVDMIGQE